MPWALLLSAQAVAATFTVNTTNDTIAADGVLSLREALLAAGTGDTVTFSWASGVRTTITLGSQLPAVGAFVVDGNQKVILAAAGIGGTNSGLRLNAGATLKGVVIADAPGLCVEVLGDGVTVGGTTTNDRNWLVGCGESGVLLAAGVDSVVVEGNSIGADHANAVDGPCTAPAGACAGVSVRSAGTGIVIKKNHIADVQGNPASLQGAGVSVTLSSGTLVQSNTIGATPSGYAAGTGTAGIGIVAAATAGNSVGGLVVDDNVIVDTVGAAIFVGPRADGATLTDNLVGATASGTAVGNNGRGIEVFGSDDHTITGNTVILSDGHGILLEGSTGGDWQSGSTVADNFVGIYWTGSAWSAQGNDGDGIRTEGDEAGGVIRGNTVTDNLANGIAVLAPNVQVVGNRVGTDPTGV